MTARRGAVFLDRDGVLNLDSPSFITSPEQFRLLPGVAVAVARINRAGLAAVVVTNQSGIGRGIMAQADLDAIHDKLRTELAASGASIDAIYRCPHAPWEGCECRKPLAGMVTTAAADLDLDLDRSYFIGDKPTDIQCGSAAGCRTVLVLSGLQQAYAPDTSTVAPDHVCQALPAAVDWILTDSSG